MSRLVAVLLVVLLARPNVLVAQSAQTASSIRPGTLVRITQTGQKARVATMVSPGTDTVLVRWEKSTGTAAVPLAEVSRLDVSTGRHRNLVKGAVLGTLGGAALGAVAAAATFEPCTSTAPFGCFGAFESRGEAGTAGAVLAGAVGLVVGTVIGIRSHEGWHRVPLDARRVAVALTPRGRATGLGVTLRF
jgi:hypothetical protein